MFIHLQKEIEILGALVLKTKEKNNRIFIIFKKMIHKKQAVNTIVRFQMNKFKSAML